MSRWDRLREKRMSVASSFSQFASNVRSGANSSSGLNKLAGKLVAVSNATAEAFSRRLGDQDIEKREGKGVTEDFSVWSMLGSSQEQIYSAPVAVSRFRIASPFPCGCTQCEGRYSFDIETVTEHVLRWGATEDFLLLPSAQTEQEIGPLRPVLFEVCKGHKETSRVSFCAGEGFFELHQRLDPANTPEEPTSPSSPLPSLTTATSTPTVLSHPADSNATPIINPPSHHLSMFSPAHFHPNFATAELPTKPSGKNHSPPSNPTTASVSEPPGFLSPAPVPSIHLALTSPPFSSAVLLPPPKRQTNNTVCPPRPTKRPSPEEIALLETSPLPTNCAAAHSSQAETTFLEHASTEATKEPPAIAVSRTNTPTDDADGSCKDHGFHSPEVSVSYPPPSRPLQRPSQQQVAAAIDLARADQNVRAVALGSLNTESTG